MPRRNFTDKTKLERVEFAGYRCEGILPSGERCNADLRFRRWDCDHDIPDRMGGKPVFENARALCKECHTRKYPADRKAIDKTKRTEARHAGVPKRVGAQPKIQSAPMPTTPKAAARAARGHKASLEPLALYQDQRPWPPLSSWHTRVCLGW